MTQAKCPYIIFIELQSAVLYQTIEIVVYKAQTKF